MDEYSMCPNCRAFLTTGDRVCPYCDNQVGPPATGRAGAGARIGGLIPATHFTTVLILLVNVALYAATAWLSGSLYEIKASALWVLGAKFGPGIWTDHQYWRLVTAGFLHGSILHIALNGWFLFVLGARAEEIFATTRFLVVYFASTVAGFCLSAVMNPVLSIGASVGIMGLYGAIVAFCLASGSPVVNQILDYLGWRALILLWAFLPGRQIDHWGHIGGFAVAWFAGTPMRSTHTRETTWRVAAGACVLMTAWCFWLMYRNFPSPEELRQLFQPNI